MRRMRALPIAVLALAACGLACGGETERRGPPHIVLVVVDTLRADHLPSYGYPVDTAPGLSRLAESGVLFERVIAPSSWTKTSVASILTGLHPDSHGVLRHRNAIPSGMPTLAKQLAARGYRTVGINTNPWLQAQFGFGAGFEVYETIRHAKESGTADEVNRRALEILAADAGPRPVFLYLHYMDVHAPYRDPENGEPEDAALEHAYRKQGLDGEGVQERVVALYDAGIRAFDAAFSAFLAQLEARLPGADTLLVVTSDHGESFREHGTTEHGQNLYPEVLEVPLFFVWRGTLPSGLRIPAQVRSVDVAPTLLALAGAEIPPDMEGEPLLPMRAGAIAARTAHSELYFRRPLDPFHYAAVTTRDHLYVQERMGGTSEFYDLRDDPLALHDLGADHPRAGDHARVLRAATVVRPDDRDLDAETREELEALGYLK